MRARYQLPARDQITRVASARARAGALQSESATIGVRGSVYANDNRLISDAGTLSGATALFFISPLSLFHLLNSRFPRGVIARVTVKVCCTGVSAANWQSAINFSQIVHEFSNCHKFAPLNWMFNSRLCPGKLQR